MHRGGASVIISAGKRGEQMVLAIDVGNSVTALGLFGPDGRLIFRSDLTTLAQSTRDQYAICLLDVFRLYGADIGAVTGAIVSSVVPAATAALCQAVERLTGKPPLLMGPGVRTGLNIKSDLHTQLGSDIVAYSVGAAAKYPTPLIVVEMGTAVAMSLLNGNVYEGCVIMPGVRVSLDALSDRAASLPRISVDPPASILGHNSVDAMRSGAVYGYASMVDGMIDRLEEASAPAACVVATGSAGAEILQFCKRKIIYDPDLLLCGLYLIHQKNTAPRQRRGCAAQGAEHCAHRRTPD